MGLVRGTTTNIEHTVKAMLLWNWRGNIIIELARGTVPDVDQAVELRLVGN